jgi:hypothetical protein
MKKIRVTTYDEKGFFDRDIDYVVEERLLRYQDGSSRGIESQIERMAELLGMITNKLVQSGAIDFNKIEEALCFLDYGEELVEDNE